MKISVILLAGGTGSRMGTSVPKQFLDIHGKPIASYSFELFSNLPYVSQVVVVSPTSYRNLFPGALFADPGERRQDSVYNAFQETSRGVDLVCIHDASRPFLQKEDVDKLLSVALECKAAALGRPIPYTVKEVKGDTVLRTLDRSTLWEVHTPQMIAPELLAEGFKYANTHHLTVTDDVSLVEHLGHPVRLVEGSGRNIKLTTPDDLALVR